MNVNLLKLILTDAIFKVINEIHRHISLMYRVLKRLLRLEFKSNHLTTSKALKCIINKILPDLEIKLSPTNLHRINYIITEKLSKTVVPLLWFKKI